MVVPYLPGLIFTVPAEVPFTKVALYVKARFDDLLGQKIQIGEEYKHITKGI
jgi:hypothetical protein